MVDEAASDTTWSTPPSTPRSPFNPSFLDGKGQSSSNTSPEKSGFVADWLNQGIDILNLPSASPRRRNFSGAYSDYGQQEAAGSSPTRRVSKRNRRQSKQELHLSFPSIHALRAWHALLQSFTSIDDLDQLDMPSPSRLDWQPPLNASQVHLNDRVSGRHDAHNAMAGASVTHLEPSSSPNFKRSKDYGIPQTRPWSRLELSGLQVLNSDGPGGAVRNEKLLCEMSVELASAPLDASINLTAARQIHRLGAESPNQGMFLP
jgi:hypothetical protein